MGSPLASLSATRGFRVKVEPSLRVPVSGRPEAAEGASEAAMDAAADAAVLGAAADAAALGALDAPVELQAARSSVAPVKSATAPVDPIRMGLLLRSGCSGGRLGTRLLQGAV